MSNFLRMINGFPRLYPEAASSAIYDESVVISTNLITGTPFTLPNSGSFVGDELIVLLDGQVLNPGEDFTYVGLGVKTEVTFTFDLLIGDNIRFRITRGP